MSALCFPLLSFTLRVTCSSSAVTLRADGAADDEEEETHERGNPEQELPPRVGVATDGYEPVPIFIIHDFLIPRTVLIPSPLPLHWTRNFKTIS